MLSDIGRDPEAPAHTLAQALDEMAGRVQRLAVVVGRDLEACDLDRQRESEQVMLTEHRGSLLTLQERLDDSLALRRVAEQGRLKAEVTTRTAELTAAGAEAARDAAVQGQDDAEHALQASTVRAAQDAACAAAASRTAEQLTERLVAAEAARCVAEDARAAAQVALSLARSEVREQQLRTAEVLAEQASGLQTRSQLPRSGGQAGIA